MGSVLIRRDKIHASWRGRQHIFQRQVVSEVPPEKEVKRLLKGWVGAATTLTNATGELSGRPLITFPVGQLWV